MSVSIVTFAQLGERSNLKTAAISPVIERFAKEEDLKQVICHSAKKCFFENTVSALPKTFLWALKGLKKFVYPPLQARKTEEYIFDLHASLRLKKADIVLFHPARFERTIKKAKKNGSTVVGIATVPHPRFDEKIQAEEHKRFDVPFETQKHFDIRTKTAENFDYIVALSTHVKDTYIQAGFSAEKIFVASLDIDADKFKPMEKDDDTFRVLFLADISLRKGLHYLLEAWEKANLSNAELVIVGRMNIPQKVKENYMKIIENDSSIWYVKHTKEPEKYYKNASVFVLPSLSEGFPKVTLEAMASGLPVITTEYGKGIVKDGETGYVVPPRNSEVLKEKIEFFVNNLGKRKEMGETAREVVLNKPRFSDEVYEIYQHIREMDQVR